MALYSITATHKGLLKLIIVAYLPAGSWLGRSWGGNSIDVGRSIGVDGSGNTYTVGNFLSDSITIATTPATTLTKVGSGDNLFIVKRTAAGVPLWAKR